MNCEEEEKKCEATDALDLGEDSEKEEEEEEELGDLPPEIAEIGSCKFESEEALQQALDAAGAGDLPVILLDGKPRLVMPSDQHNKFTSSYSMQFERLWSRNRWGFASSTCKIYIENGRSRDPDLSYWGYPRCTRDATTGCLEPVWGSVPDVVIQFSWHNNLDYEEKAINDMMNLALEEDHGALSSTRPTLGYLIKVKFSKKRTLEQAIKGSKTQDMEGLDIYRLHHGTTIADARDPTNANADHWLYLPTGPEYLITITPGDLGITGFWALLCGEYTIKASDVFKKMQKHHQERQKKGLAT